MIITRLWGGLGNQLFQYAAGRALAIRTGTDLVFDDGQCHLDPTRPYELCHFKVVGRPWNQAESRWADRMIRFSRPTNDRTSVVARTAKIIVRPCLNPYFAYVEDRRTGFQPDVFAHSGHVYLAGTWAGENYFVSVAEQVRAEFEFAQPPDALNCETLVRIGDSESVCLHVRRGDYVSIPETTRRHGLCTLDYYRQGFAHIAGRVDNPTAFVFSDDPDWTRDNIRLGVPTHYVTHNVGRKNYEDLRLMAACKHFVIANSTFSWWGAWLGRHPDKIVVAPRQWFADTVNVYDPVPGTWVRL